MNETPDRQRPTATADPHGSGTGFQQSEAVVRFASHIVSVLAARSNLPEPVVRQTLLLQLIEAVIAEDPGAAARLLETLRAHKIPLESLADHYLPEAARALGVLWSRDQADFVDVTIGTARLQALLRGLDSDAALDLSQRPVIGAVLMIVPGGEQHTFGALVAASKLRRRGISVCLRLMPRTNELREVLRSRHFDGAMISVGARENLDMARKLVKLLRGSAESNVPVIVGGALLAECEDLARETGADAATNDLDRALALCGVQASVTQTAGLRTRQG